MKKKLSIIIPCYNERKTILAIIKKIKLQKKIKKQIILVDDGSTDGTRKIIEDKISKYVQRIIYHKKNLGKGAAIKSGKKYVNGDIILIQDADLEYDPRDYDRLINPIINLNYKVVYGSRVLNKRRYASKNFISLFRIFANHILTTVSNIINNQNLTDAHTCYKVFHKSVFKNLNLKENDFSFCPEVTTKISNKNIKIHEVPINYKGREFSEGKKITFRDAIKAIYVLFKYKFFV